MAKEFPMTQHTHATDSLALVDNPIDNVVQPDFKPQRTRKLAFGIFALVLLLVALGATAYWFLIASRYVSTDNAYTAVELAAVSPAVDGIVQTITVVDTQSVKAGDILVILDDTDARLALAQAEAELGQAERRVRSYYANGEGLAAQVSSREAVQRQVNHRGDEQRDGHETRKHRNGDPVGRLLCRLSEITTGCCRHTRKQQSEQAGDAATQESSPHFWFASLMISELS